MADDSIIPDELVLRRWQSMREAINPLIERGQNEHLWPVSPRSSVWTDDARVNPYLASQAASVSLTSALDHLHALTVLVFEAGALHPYAPFTLGSRMY